MLANTSAKIGTRISFQSKDSKSCHTPNQHLYHCANWKIKGFNLPHLISMKWQMIIFPLTGYKKIIMILAPSQYIAMEITFVFAVVGKAGLELIKGIFLDKIERAKVINLKGFCSFISLYQKKQYSGYRGEIILAILTYLYADSTQWTSLLGVDTTAIPKHFLLIRVLLYHRRKCIE